MTSVAACSDIVFFFSSRRRHTRFDCDWSSDVCSSDLGAAEFRQLAFELGDFGTEDKAAVIDDPPDRLIHPRPDMAPLRAEIDKLDRLQIGRASCRERV